MDKLCTCLLKTGPRQGQPCGAKVKSGRFCGRHTGCASWGSPRARARSPHARSPQRSARYSPRTEQRVRDMVIEYREIHLPFEKFMEKLVEAFPNIPKKELSKMATLLFKKKEAIARGRDCRACERKIRHALKVHRA